MSKSPLSDIMKQATTVKPIKGAGGTVIMPKDLGTPPPTFRPGKSGMTPPKPPGVKRGTGGKFESHPGSRKT